MRHDAGDAETVELGAGLKWSVPGLRLSGNVGVRGLVVHEDARFGLGIEARVPDGAGRGARAPAPDLRLTGALRW